MAMLAAAGSGGEEILAELLHELPHIIKAALEYGAPGALFVGAVALVIGLASQD
jgi:hypothetical protein